MSGEEAIIKSLLDEIKDAKGVVRAEVIDSYRAFLVATEIKRNLDKKD